MAIGFVQSSKCRRVPTTVARLSARNPIARVGERSVESALALADSFGRHLAVLAQKIGGIAFRIDIPEYVLVVGMDVNSNCRSAAVETCLLAISAARQHFVDAGSGGDSKAPLIAGVHHGPLFWAPSLGDPALGATINQAEEVVNQAVLQGLPLVVSPEVSAALDSNFVVSPLGKQSVSRLFSVRRKGDIGGSH